VRDRLALVPRRSAGLACSELVYRREVVATQELDRTLEDIAEEAVGFRPKVPLLARPSRDDAGLAGVAYDNPMDWIVRKHTERK